MLQSINRRSVTAAIGAAAVAMPAACLPAIADGKGPDRALAHLIEDHRVAYRAFCKANDREQKMTMAYKDADNDPTMVVPCLLGGGFEVRLGHEHCQKRIADAYKDQRDQLKRLSRVAPELAEQVRAVMDAKEAENRDLMDGMFAEEDDRQEAFGLAGAKRDLEATGEAEIEAAIAVCAHRCRTLEEARLKAEYLATAPGLSDGLQPEHVEALLGSFRA